MAPALKKLPQGSWFVDDVDGDPCNGLYYFHPYIIIIIGTIGCTPSSVTHGIYCVL